MRARVATANAQANTLLSVCVCLFTGLLVSVCVCLSRFSLFSPHLIERCHLFVSWCSSLCSLLVAPQEACRSHYSQKSAFLLSTLGFFQSILLTLKPKESLKEKKIWNSETAFCRCCVILSKIFSISRCKKMIFIDLFQSKRKQNFVFTAQNPELCKFRNTEVRVRSDFSSALDSGWNILSWRIETNFGCLLIKRFCFGFFFTKWGVFLLNSTLFSWHF